MRAATFDETPAVAPAQPMRGWLTSTKTQVAVLFLFALFARASALGDPNYHVDEAFYLLVGKAMQQGSVPYVDLWDRKPFGLFAFYWLLSLISTSIWSVHIAALGFVTATGAIVTRLARRWADATGALLAGLISIAMLGPLIGNSGQAPVFYNLFVIGGVALLIGEAMREGHAPRLSRAAAAATLAGLAVWFKPTAVFEGAFVVLGFCLLAWQRDRTQFLRLALTCAALAALPTLGTYAAYAASGHFDAIWQATVTSNFDKLPNPDWIWRRTVFFFFLITAPLTASALIGAFAGFRDPRHRRVARWMLGWSMAGIAGFVVIPNFYSHYALSLVPICAVLAAPAFSRGFVGRGLALFVIFWGLTQGQSLLPIRGIDSQAQFDRAVAAIEANRHGGKLYVFDGPVALYNATGATWTGRFPFPEHLSNAIEAPALGVDPVAEMEKVLNARPEVVVLTTSPKPNYNHETFAVLHARLSSEYQPVCAMPAYDFEHKYWILIYTRSAQPDRSKCHGGTWSKAPSWLVNPKAFGLMDSANTFIVPTTGSEKP